MTELDCRTPVGEVWVARQSALTRIIALALGTDAVETPLRSAASLDALFSRAGVLAAVAEIKCRDMSYDELLQYGSYLITDDKIQRGRRIAAELAVPFFLFVGLRTDQRIVYWQLADADGVMTTATTVNVTDTKRTCNDATPIARANAYLALDTMRELHFRTPRC
jgi:hypothetical protein